MYTLHTKILQFCFLNQIGLIISRGWVKAMDVINWFYLGKISR